MILLKKTLYNEIILMNPSLAYIQLDVYKMSLEGLANFKQLYSFKTVLGMK